MERIDKIISSQGYGSRKEISKMAKNGRIYVNGIVCKSADMKIDPLNDKILFCGEEVKYSKFVYILLNKKAGYITATEDKKQDTVLKLLPERYQKMDIFPAGRLDKDTEGLLLLTNDGEFSHSIMSPKNHVEKTYYAKIEGTLIEDSVKLVEEGLELGDGLQCMPAKLKIINDTEIELTIKEGKYHQVKRMVACLGAKVVYLKRIAIGNLRISDDMELGDFKLLSEVDILEIKNFCKN